MHLDGLSYREMGEVLGISENHVGVRLHRIRKQLAEQLKGLKS
jgi:RNA polymerase sigma-70 factor (ECF subfamily)